MGLITNLKSTSMIFISFFIILVVFQIYMLRNACNSEFIIQIIQKNSYQIKSSIYDLDKKMNHILKVEVKTEENLEKLDKFNKKIDVASYLPYWDFTTLSNLNNFRFTIFNNVCKKEEIDLLIFVTSTPGHGDTRKVIRETWGSWKNQRIKILFVLGAVRTQEEQNMIQDENLRNRDILQGNFLDAYRNLTYKHVMDLKYTLYYCPQTKFIVKMDDDMFLNPENLQRFMMNLQGCPDFIFCYHRDNLIVWRNNSKWDVPFEDFPNAVYPRYCLGNWPIIYPFEVAVNLYREVQKGDFLFIEDAYITGIIAERLNLRHIQADEFTLDAKTTGDLVNLTTDVKDVPTDYLYTWHSIKPGEMLKLHRLLINHQPNITKKPTC